MRTRLTKEYLHGKLFYVVEVYDQVWFVHKSYPYSKESEARATAQEMSLFDDYKSYLNELLWNKTGYLEIMKEWQIKR